MLILFVRLNGVLHLLHLSMDNFDYFISFIITPFNSNWRMSIDEKTMCSQIGKRFCRGWLIEERVDEFVIEKYIEINKGISIMYADSDPHSYSVTIQ